MKKIIILIFFLFFSEHISYSQSGWALQNFAPDVGRLFTIQFVDSINGYIGSFRGSTIGSSGFAKTTDGGSSWFAIHDSTPAHPVESMIFLNKDTGFVGTFATPFSTLRKTINGGYNWSVIRSSFLSGYTSVSFININTGICLMDANSQGNTFVLKTTTGGSIWDTIFNVNHSYRLEDVKMINKDTILISGDNWPYTGMVVVSFNGGQDWTVDTSEFPGMFELNAITLMDNKNIIVGGSNYLAKTTNSGFNWTTIYHGFNAYITSLEYFDTNNIRIAGGANTASNLCAFLYTTNGGLNWISFTDFEQDFIVGDMAFINNNTGWIVGGIANTYTPVVYKTTNGGLTFAGQNILDVPSTYKLYQNYPNPFNPSTKIGFDLLKAGNVRLTVYDMLGHETAVLVNNEFKQSGNYSVDFNASKLSSGIYFYRLETEGFTDNKKMILIK